MMDSPSWMVILMLYVTRGCHATRIYLPALGWLEGTTMPDYDSNMFEAFLGVPYAQPPVGLLRLAQPLVTRPWTDTLDATQPKPDCIQKNYLLPNPVISGVEDCLYMNIYRPIRSNYTHTLPVMVYIHGGGFFAGTASPLIHGPEFFMTTKKVILVTLTYRLGALGFLSTGDANMPGNFGLKDQQLALLFIRIFIGEFGGDSDRVTIFGQSAGAVSVHLHMLSPTSKGLFQSAIVMSGNAMAPFALLVEKPLDQVRQQAIYVNISNPMTKSTVGLTNALRQVDATQLVESGDNFHYWDVDPLTVFRPCIEPESRDAFLTEDPSAIVASGKYTMVPWMTGMVPEEGAVRGLAIFVKMKNSFNSLFEYLFWKLMELADIENRQLAVKILIDFYFNGIKELNNDTVQGLVDSITDRGFAVPLHKNIGLYIDKAQQDTNPIYLYKFAYRGAVSYSMLYTGNINDYGVVHCDDLIYLFRSPLLFGPDYPAKGTTDEKVMREMIDMYVTFGTTKKPKMADKLRRCTRARFNRYDKTCDYWVLANNADSFVVEVREDINNYRLSVWSRILPN